MSGITKQEIWDLLTRPDDPKADRQDQRGMHTIGRALVAIAHRHPLRHTSLGSQMPCGFHDYDDERGTSMAKFYTENGYLTSKQVKWWLHPNQYGEPRICKYWWQLKQVADDKVFMAVSRRRKYLPTQLDLFDSDETLMDRAEALERYNQQKQQARAHQRSEYFRGQYR